MINIIEDSLFRMININPFCSPVATSFSNIHWKGIQKPTSWRFHKYHIISISYQIILFLHHTCICTVSVWDSLLWSHSPQFQWPLYHPVSPWKHHCQSTPHSFGFKATPLTSRNEASLNRWLPCKNVPGNGHGTWRWSTLIQRQGKRGQHSQQEVPNVKKRDRFHVVHSNTCLILLDRVVARSGIHSAYCFLFFLWLWFTCWYTMIETLPPKVLKLWALQTLPRCDP